MADNVLRQGVQGITDLIGDSGLINLDFADVETVMKNSGVSIMGMGKASGENRAIKAIENALSSPLLNSNDVTGANSILINIASGTGEHEITMDELGEITDYMYEAASDEALIIRGLSKDDNLKEEISVTVIATGFESNSIFQPYKAKKPSKVELMQPGNQNPARIIPETGSDVFSVHEKGRSSIITDLEEEQGVIDFSMPRSGDLEEIRSTRSAESQDVQDKPGSTLRKVKHMQNLLKKEGLSNQAMKENIDSFEDVPAYVRRNMIKGVPDPNPETRLSKFTLSSDDNDEPILRENNAYLNDNVD
jgi:cell division protein FtsZ